MVLVNALSRTTSGTEIRTIIFGVDVIHPHLGEDMIVVVRMRPFCTKILVVNFSCGLKCLLFLKAG
jgi:hypothetical protein